MHPNDDSISNFHSERLNIVSSSKVQTRSKYDLSNKPEITTSMLYKNNRDPVYSTSNLNSKKIDYSEYTTNNISRQTPKSKYQNMVPSRGSYNLNKSIEMNSNRGMHASDRLYNDDTQSFRNPRTSNPEPFRTIKTMKSISKCPSEKFSNLKNLNLNTADKHYYRNEKSSELVRDGRTYSNWIYNSDNSANNDSPNKPANGRSNPENVKYLNDADFKGNKPYKLPSTYIDSYRYRSISFQNNIGSRNGRDHNEITVKSTLGQERKSENYHAKYNKHSDSINFEERVNARKAMRSKEFEKLYQESTEGNLKSPPINELSKNRLNVNTSYDRTRKTLAEQIHRHSQLKSNESYKNIESLNSSRTNREPNKPKS